MKSTDVMVGQILEPKQPSTWNNDEFLIVALDHAKDIIVAVNYTRGMTTQYAYPAWVWGGYKVKGSIPSTVSANVVVSDGAQEPPKKPGRRQVSHNGKDWCDYRLLLDADPFESYEHRREI